MCDDVIRYWTNPAVELIDWMPSSGGTAADRVVQAARVSSGVEGTPAANKGLLEMLMRDRHGSPFEHVVFTWLVKTPLFVAREFMRHRIASYNETSGRYRKMEPIFYLPPRERHLVI
jgi:thymidylate synthase (FAD)